MKLGVITDEVSQDVTVAAEFAVRHGLTELEIRSVNGKNPFELSERDIVSIHTIAKQYHLHVAAFSAPLFKCSITDKAAVAAHIAGFERLCQYSSVLDCTLIRGFDFWEEGASLEARVQAYQPILALCEQYGVTCVLEYDPSVHSNTAAKVRQFVKAVGSSYLGALYDPGNGLWSDPEDIPYPNDYDLLSPYIRHIHIKDAICANGKTEAVKVGTGKVDYTGLFARLKSENYSGCIMLETHYRKATQLTEEQLKRPGGTVFSNGAYEASEESILSLLSLL